MDFAHIRPQMNQGGEVKDSHAHLLQSSSSFQADAAVEAQNGSGDEDDFVEGVCRAPKFVHVDLHTLESMVLLGEGGAVILGHCELEVVFVGAQPTSVSLSLRKTSINLVLSLGFLTRPFLMPLVIKWWWT